MEGPRITPGDTRFSHWHVWCCRHGYCAPEREESMRTPPKGFFRCLALPILLLSIGCGANASAGATSCPHTFDGVIDVARPSQTPDNGLGATIEDWDACAQSMQCR